MGLRLLRITPDAVAALVRMVARRVPSDLRAVPQHGANGLDGPRRMFNLVVRSDEWRDPPTRLSGLVEWTPYMGAPKEVQFAIRLLTTIGDGMSSKARMTNGLSEQEMQFLGGQILDVVRRLKECSARFARP